MAKSITIGSHQYPTKKAAKDFIIAIRDRYPDSDHIGEDDHNFLSELLWSHPEACDKIGAGISHFTVTTDSVFGRTRHFVVHRLDGTSTDFSFHSCINGRNERGDRLEAMRRAIEPDILAFRNQAFETDIEVRCRVDGSVLTHNTCHVDHEAPKTFLVIVGDWLEDSTLSLDDLEITPPRDNQTVTSMTNHDQIRSWRSFHNRHATLRLTTPRANLSVSRSKK
jgi:Protein of unknown function (DUF3223)